MEYWALSLWPLAFLLGHMAVGIYGGGYQTRFLLPIIPATSIISAIGVVKFPEYSSIAVAFVAIGAMHVMFYGIMFYPLFCDFEFNVFDIIQTTIDSPQYVPESREIYASIFRYMRHYGLNRTIH